MLSHQRSNSKQIPRPSPPISYPIPQEDPFASYYQGVPTASSSAQLPLRPSRPSASASNPMTWLSRVSATPSSRSIQSTSSKTNRPSKPISISEPKFKASSELSSSQRSTGTLGGGAIVVRTPQEALLGVGVGPYDQEGDEEAHYEAIIPENGVNESPSPPESPPLPPVPVTRTLSTASSTLFLPRESPRKPTRPPPSTSGPNPRPALKPTVSSQSLVSTTKTSPRVPAIPLNIPPTPPQGPFEPVLVSSIPNGVMDCSKIIITLETSTATHRTTFGTLTSRPSNLATYLTSLIPKSTRESDAASVYSSPGSPGDSVPPDSAFNSIFQRHLTSSGVLPPQHSSTIHVFLDRPSAPYAHILSYLRTPISTPDTPATLPRAAQLSSVSASRLEALLELRDEAHYLNLEELCKLCTDEIRHRQASSMHSRERSSMSSNSIFTMRTSNDRLESDSVHRREYSRDSRSVLNDSSLSTPSVVSIPGVSRPPPSVRPMLHNRYESLKTPPAGWV